MLIIFAMLCFLPTLLCADAVPVACLQVCFTQGPRRERGVCVAPLL